MLIMSGWQGSGGWILSEDSYWDESISASRYFRGVRGGFDALIADLEQDRFGAQVLMIWESSRGSRRVGEWVRLLELCEQRAVLIFVAAHGRCYEPGNGRVGVRCWKMRWIVSMSR
jgi:site-specific DNA recombinase